MKDHSIPQEKLRKPQMSHATTGLEIRMPICKIPELQRFISMFTSAVRKWMPIEFKCAHQEHRAI